MFEFPYPPNPKGGLRSGKVGHSIPSAVSDLICLTEQVPSFHT